MEQSKKEQRYSRIYQQLEELVKPVNNFNSRAATIVALLHHKMDYFFWTGFYFLVKGDLLVSFYQGPLACLKLKKDTGVCWSAIQNQNSVIVGNVEEFPGHIACNPLSKSEIAIPVFDGQQKNSIIGVLDIDSKELNSFNRVDEIWLKKFLYLLYI